MADPSAFGGFEHPGGLVGVAAEWPFAVDVLSGLDRGHYRQEVIGHLHADRDQIDIRMSRQHFSIGKRQRYSEMPGSRFCRILPGRADGGDLELRKSLQGRNMGDRGETPVRAYSDDSHPDFAACRHESPLQYPSCIPTAARARS